ncbi:MAG: hypothetical protein K6U14_09720 [Firmicutes bacterium]|nr:hypothetical protein [Alicyclobacillaceae bacterium]MCL6497890.1 hypothetical protein [Bacillota bacterium]
MKVVASGHPGIEAWVQERYAGPVASVAFTWEDLLDRLGEAQGVFLGSRLPGLPPPEQVAERLLEWPGEWVVWVGAEEAATWRAALEPVRADVALWVGPVGPDRLETWLNHIVTPEAADPLPRRWAVYTPDGAYPRTRFWTWVAERARAEHGLGAIADFAWADPQVTRHLVPGRSRWAPTAGEHLWLRRVPWGYICPAPAPWLGVTASPEAQALTRVTRRTAWTAFDFGADLRSPLWLPTLAVIEEVWVLGVEALSRDEWLAVVAWLRDVGPRLTIAAVVRTDGAPRWVREEPVSLRSWPGPEGSAERVQSPREDRVAAPSAQVLGHGPRREGRMGWWKFIGRRVRKT